MELLTASLATAAIIGSLCWDVHLTHRMGRRYYRWVCWVPTKPARISGLPSPGRHLRSESLVLAVSGEGLQVRSTQKKNHILLRISADGQVRAGTSVWMWGCLAVWSGIMVLLAVISLHQEPLSAALMFSAVVAIGAVTWAATRSRTHAMIAAAERVVARQVHEEDLREIG